MSSGSIEYRSSRPSDLANDVNWLTYCEIVAADFSSRFAQVANRRSCSSIIVFAGLRQVLHVNLANRLVNEAIEQVAWDLATRTASATSGPPDSLAQRDGSRKVAEMRIERSAATH